MMRHLRFHLCFWAMIGAAALGWGASCGYQRLFLGQTVDEQWQAGDCTSPPPGNHVYDYFLFSGAAGQQVTATVTYSNVALDPVVVAFQSLYGTAVTSASGASPVSATYTLPASGYYVLVVGSLAPLGYGDYSVALAASSGGAGGCASGMCLNNGRFQVTATWRKSDGTTGAATPALFTNDTGYFWFFDDSNVELVLKVLDARAVNGQFWVFASGLTNVGVDITVVDTETGSVKTYQNPLGTAFQPIQDTSGFAPPAQNANVGGVWDGTVAFAGGGQQNITLTLSQNGTSVTGTTAVVGEAGTGNLTGSISGQVFAFTITEPSACAAHFAGTGIVDDTGIHMSGSYSGSDCEAASSGTFTATRR